MEGINSLIESYGSTYTLDEQFDVKYAINLASYWESAWYSKGYNTSAKSRVQRRVLSIRELHLFHAVRN